MNTTEASVTKSVMETYTIRNRGEYATIALRCSEAKGEDRYYTGEILINSSFGSWANYWGACGRPFKEFLQKLDFHYTFGKFMGASLEVFDEDETIADIKRKLIEVRRENRITHEEVRDLWEQVDDIETYSEESFGNGCREIGSNLGPRHPLHDYFNEPWDLKRTKPDVQATGFWREIWPHFITELKKETDAGVAAALAPEQSPLCVGNRSDQVHSVSWLKGSACLYCGERRTDGVHLPVGGHQ